MIYLGDNNKGRYMVQPNDILSLKDNMIKNSKCHLVVCRYAFSQPDRDAAVIPKRRWENMLSARVFAVMVAVRLYVYGCQGCHKSVPLNPSGC